MEGKELIEVIRKLSDEQRQELAEALLPSQKTSRRIESKRELRGKLDRGYQLGCDLIERYDPESGDPPTYNEVLASVAAAGE